LGGEAVGEIDGNGRGMAQEYVYLYEKCHKVSEDGYVSR